MIILIYHFKIQLIIKMNDWQYLKLKFYFTNFFTPEKEYNKKLAFLFAKYCADTGNYDKRIEYQNFIKKVNNPFTTRYDRTEIQDLACKISPGLGYVDLINNMINTL